MVFSSTDPSSPFLFNLNLMVSILSLFGSSLMIYFCFKIKRDSVTTKLIMSIAIADFFYSIANLMSQFEGDSVNFLCRTEAVLRQVSNTASAFITGSFTLFCYKIVTHGNKFNKKAFLNNAIIFSVLVGLTLALSPLYFDHIHYENGSIICWVTFSSSETDVNTRILVMLYIKGISMVLPIILTPIGYIFVIAKMKKESGGLNNKLNKRIYKLMWYPLLLCLTFSPSLVDNFRQAYTNEPSPVIMKAVHILFTHIIGLTNAIVYGLQRKISYVMNQENRRKLGSLSSNTSNFSL